ncbi:hypothetical protein MMC06_000907 [Schaereria dolodes]|nr:hypothetical protein [Schaereria dolodes]
MSAPKVAIIGAGPAGCTLARLLIRANIPVTVFEGEESPEIRQQGGTLDLHTATGLAVLKEAGLYDEFLKYARFDGEALRVTDKKFRTYLNFGGTNPENTRGRPEIDRVQLRLLLLESLPEGVISWNCRLRSVSDDLSLHFDHGTEQGFGLVVGADGAWSKVRPVVTQQQPFYAGMGGMDLFISDAKERYPDLYKRVNRGSILSVGNGKNITAQQKGDGSLIVYASSRRDEHWMNSCEYDIHDPKAVKEAIAKEHHDWAPELVKFTQVADEKNMVARSLYMLPVGLQWENRPGVTLIGDSAHLMTPYAGEGVNLAMEDAMNLAHAIIAADEAGGKEALNERVKEFENDMFKRAAKTAALTKGNMDDFFDQGAPASIIESFIIRGARNEVNAFVTACIGVVVYFYFFWFKLYLRIFTHH